MALQIKKFSMSRMTIGDCVLFHQGVLADIAEATPAALHIETQYPAYQASVELLASVVNRQQGYSSTKKLKDADYLRDRAGGTVQSVVNDYLNSPVDTKREAAELLAMPLGPYKDIRQHGYKKQTAEVDGMLAILAKPEYAEAIRILNLTEEVEVLAETNARIKALLSEKQDEVIEHQAQSDLSSEELVADANAKYEGIVLVVNAFAIAMPSEVIDHFIKRTNALVEMYTVDNSGGASGGTAPDSDTTPDDDTTPEGGETPDEGGTTPDEGGSDNGGGETPTPTPGGGDDDEEVVG